MRGIDFNHNWKFKLENEELDIKKASEELRCWNPWLNDAERYYAVTRFDESDEEWRNVRLPHDWSVEFPFDMEKGEGCTGYLPGGMGVYRKHFITTEAMVGKKVIVNFDGIYNRSTIYMNEKLLKFHPYGYSPCLVDISDNLKPLGEENVLTVRVDHSRYADSRWYTGSGIYRKVSLHILEQVNIPIWGMYFTTPSVSETLACIHGEVELENGLEVDKRVEIILNLVDKDETIVKTERREMYLHAKDTQTLYVDMQLENPTLWDMDTPYLYEVEAAIFCDGKFVQKESISLGMRSFSFDKDTGFYLNGKNHKLKGVCLHHDAGLVGSAVPKDVWRRRFEILQESGCNAIRTAHNPFSEDFLDLCDEMGFVVQEEFFDEWDYGKDKRLNCYDRIFDYITRGYSEFFDKYAESDLKTVMKRDRNHPCIIQWSLGNEVEWTYPRCETLNGYFNNPCPSWERDQKYGGNHWGDVKPPYSIEKIQEIIKNTPEEHTEVVKTAARLAKYTREMDKSRAITTNCTLPTISHELGVMDYLDIVGYSHRAIIYDHLREHYNNKPAFGCETGVTWKNLKAMYDHEHIFGMFIWTGINYMGEAHCRKGAPRARTGCGSMLDFACFKTNNFHMFKSWWSEKPCMYAATALASISPFEKDASGKLVERTGLEYANKLDNKSYLHEHWNYITGEEILIEAFSNCSEVTLYVNDHKYETLKPMDYVDRACKWIVPYEKGTLKLVGQLNGETCEYVIHDTTGLDHVVLKSDKDVITCDYDSVAHIIVELEDQAGNKLVQAEHQVEFEITGPYINMGVDNGSPRSFQTYQQTSVKTSRGHALMILQGKEPGEITVKAVVTKADGKYVSNIVTIQVV